MQFKAGLTCCISALFIPCKFRQDFTCSISILLTLSSETVKINIICDGFLFCSFEDCVTSSFIPIKPFNDIKEHQPTVEVEEFVQESTKYSRPYRVYKNQIYIYPKHLKYDSQKYFNKVQYMTNSGQHWVVVYCMSSH